MVLFTVVQKIHSQSLSVCANFINTVLLSCYPFLQLIYVKFWWLSLSSTFNISKMDLPDPINIPATCLGGKMVLENKPRSYSKLVDE